MCIIKYKLIKGNNGFCAIFKIIKSDLFCCHAIYSNAPLFSIYFLYITIFLLIQPFSGESTLPVSLHRKKKHMNLMYCVGSLFLNCENRRSLRG